MNQVSDISDSLMKTINKYKHHPSILPIYSKLSRPESFSFNATFEKKKKSPYMCGYSKGFSTQQAYFL